MANKVLDDEKQLQLVNGEIREVETQKYTMSDAALEQRRQNARRMAEDSERIAIMQKALVIGQKANREEPQTMLDCFHEYLDMARRDGHRIGNMTAYMAMGITKEDADKWYDGLRRGGDPRYRQLIGYVKMVCAAYREDLALYGKIHPALAIFWQRNFDGLTNEDILRVDTVDPLGEVKSKDEIKEKYADLPED